MKSSEDIIGSPKGNPTTNKLAMVVTHDWKHANFAHSRSRNCTHKGY